MHVIITPLDYDCNLVTLQCRKGESSSALLCWGFVFQKFKLPGETLWNQFAQLHLGLLCSCTSSGSTQVMFKLRSQCQQQSRSLPPTAAWEWWGTWRVQQCCCFTKGALLGGFGSHFGSCESPAGSPQTFLEQPEFGSQLLNCGTDSVSVGTAELVGTWLIKVLRFF